MARSAGALDALHVDDPDTDIRAVFSWSLRNLSPAAGRLWRLLALHPGPDIAVTAAASLAAVPLADAVRLLGELTRANLLTMHVPGRYAFHDLLRAYAAEQLESGATRDRATLRLLDHHLHTGHAAALLLRPTRDPVVLTPPQPGVEPERPDSYEAAVAWFVAEHAALQRMIETAVAEGRDTHAWQLGWAFSWYLLRQGNWRQRVTVQQVALAAAGRLGDRAAQAAILEGLARSHTRLGALDDARSVYQRALVLSAELGDHAGQAHNHMGLAYVADQQGRHADSSWHEKQSLALVCEAGDGLGDANSVNGVGWVLYGGMRVASKRDRPGNYERALEYCSEAMKLLVEQDHRDGQAAMWDSLGRIHQALGNLVDAIDCHQRAVDITRQIGDRYLEAEALLGLGDTHQAAGDPDDAAEAWHEALVIFEELNHRRAESVRAKLAGDAGR
jgi:tetratricopeptide (TPR) repeat protein